MKSGYLYLLVYMLSVTLVSAQPVDREILDQHIRSNEKKWLQQYLDFVSIPNLATDQSGIQRNTRFIMDLMKESGIENVQLLEADQQQVPPAIYGKVIVPGATQTIVFYAHYDGQPVDAAQWLPGWKPFEPLIIDSAPIKKIYCY